MSKISRGGSLYFSMTGILIDFFKIPSNDNPLVEDLGPVMMEFGEIWLMSREKIKKRFEEKLAQCQINAHLGIKVVKCLHCELVSCADDDFSTLQNLLQVVKPGIVNRANATCIDQYSGGLM